MAIYVYDKSGNKRAWAGAEDDASLAKLGLSKTQPTTGYVKETKATPTINYSNSSNNSSNSSDYPTSGSVWVTRPDGSQTATSARDLQKLLAKGYSYVGVRTNDTGLYSSDGDLIQSKSGSSNKNSSYGSNKNSSYGSNIDNVYDQQRKSLVAQLRASIAKAKGSYTDIISKAPQTYQPLRNQTALTKEQQLRSALESQSLTGDRGGIGRQGLLDINTAAGNQMNDINLQQQNVINDANSAISSLDEQAAFKESSITADMASQKLQALLAENTRIDELNRDQERYSQEYSDRQKQQEFNNSNTLADREAEAASKALKSEIETMGRYYNDFKAEIDRRQGTADKSDDALIPYLWAARAEKQAKQLADADNSASQAYKNAYNMWLQLGVATPEVARILGIEAGAKTLDKVKAEYSTNKPYYSPNSGGSSGSSGSTPKPKPFYLD
jgi:hypothetical protein